MIVLQVAFLGFIFQHQAYPGKGPVQNLIVRLLPPTHCFLSSPAVLNCV